MQRKQYGLQNPNYFAPSSWENSSHESVCPAFRRIAMPQSIDSFVNSSAKGYFGLISVTTSMSSPCTHMLVSVRTCSCWECAQGCVSGCKLCRYSHWCPAKQLDRCAASIRWRTGSLTPLPTPTVVDFTLDVWASIVGGIFFLWSELVFIWCLITLASSPLEYCSLIYLLFGKGTHGLFKVWLYLLFYCFFPKSLVRPELQITVFYWVPCVCSCSFGGGLMSAKQSLCPRFYSHLRHNT